MTTKPVMPHRVNCAPLFLTHFCSPDKIFVHAQKDKERNRHQCQHKDLVNGATKPVLIPLSLLIICATASSGTLKVTRRVMNGQSEVFFHI